MINLPVIAEGRIGTIDLNSNVIEINEKNLISFNCNITGRCCKQNQVPIVDHEIQRIESAGYSDFISDLPPVVTSEGSTYWIKRNSRTCVFLEGNRCKIHSIKPFSCRMFPFQLIQVEDKIYDVFISETNSCDNVRVFNGSGSTNKMNLMFALDLLHSYLLEISD